jgi:hypothetical protein
MNSMIIAQQLPSALCKMASDGFAGSRGDTT